MNVFCYILLSEIHKESKQYWPEYGRYLKTRIPQNPTIYDIFTNSKLITKRQ